MKIFLSTLSAILVAAIIIWFVVSAHNARVAVASAMQREELRKIILARELEHANSGVCHGLGGIGFPASLASLISRNRARIFLALGSN